MFAQGCASVCVCVRASVGGKLTEESKEACVFKRDEDERGKHISRTNLSTVFNKVFEH